MQFTTSSIDKKTWLLIAGGAIFGSLLTLSIFVITGPRFDNDRFAGARFDHGMRQDFSRGGEQGGDMTQGAGIGKRMGRGEKGEHNQNCEMMNATGAIQQTGITN